ncbi:DUF5694 domain-containing protein [Corticicoccus populi]|uniref:DUF5694 domain-containing protein n=1 Tax=Corticicoccus populi TaxID=1812821 RepID=A0ABW5WUD7_9STAP
MKPEILIVGTFHFFSTTDLIKNDDLFNQEEHYNEVIELIDILKKFKPSALAAEWTKDTQSILDKQYQSYLENDFNLSENEIHQILFRLGQSENIPRINAVDWMDSIGERNFGDIIEWAKKNQHEFYTELIEKISVNELTKGDSLMKNFKKINDENSIFHSHQAHLKVSQIGSETDYIGIDWVRWWYQRNLIIYKNLIDIINEGHSRVLLLVGGAHIHLVRQFLEETGEANVLTFNDLDIT